MVAVFALRWNYRATAQLRPVQIRLLKKGFPTTIFADRGLSPGQDVAGRRVRLPSQEFVFT